MLYTVIMPKHLQLSKQALTLNACPLAFSQPVLPFFSTREQTLSHFLRPVPNLKPSFLLGSLVASSILLLEHFVQSAFITLGLHCLFYLSTL